MDNVIGVEEAAEIIGVSKRAVNALLNRGTIKGKKIGPVWAIDKLSVLEYTRQKQSSEQTGNNRPQK